MSSHSNDLDNNYAALQKYCLLHQLNPCNGTKKALKQKYLVHQGRSTPQWGQQTARRLKREKGALRNVFRTLTRERSTDAIEAELQALTPAQRTDWLHR